MASRRGRPERLEALIREGEALGLDEATDVHSNFRNAELAEESHVLARIVAKNRSAPVSLLRALSRSEDEATRKGVVTNPRAPYDVLSYLERQFPDVFVINPALELYNSVKI